MGTFLTTLYIRVKFNILWKQSGRKRYWINCWRIFLYVLLSVTTKSYIQKNSHDYKYTTCELSFLSKHFEKKNILRFFLKLEHIRLAYIQTLKYTQNLQNLKELKFCFASSDNHIWRKKFVLSTFSNTSIFPERSNLYIFDVL